MRYSFIERILYASEALESTGGRIISNIDVPSMSHGLVLQIFITVLSQVESDSCVRESGIAGKSVYFCSRRSFNFKRSKPLSTLLALLCSRWHSQLLALLIRSHRYDSFELLVRLESFPSRYRLLTVYCWRYCL